MTNAEKWIQWNVHRLALTDAEVSKFRAAGMRLWRRRCQAGLDPATGKRRKAGK